jgi:dihydrofolate reductase
MSELIYSAITSLDGYIEDEAGNFDWATPDAEVHAFVNDLERPIGTYLYGRRMYDTMAVWETMGGAEDHPVERDYAEIWRATDKIVYSTTLDAVSTAKTRIERTFDTDAIRAMKASAAHDITVGGPDLAAQAIAAGLVDEIGLFVTPIALGGGKPVLPRHARVQLELRDVHTFDSGVVYLCYRTTY